MSEPEFDIPDEALVLRFGRGTRELYERACEQAAKIPAIGEPAFSVRAAVGMDARELKDAPPAARWDEWTATTGKDLKIAGLQSRKTGNDPLHYSILCPDGITDEVWAIIKRTFQ